MPNTEQQPHDRASALFDEYVRKGGAQRDEAGRVVFASSAHLFDFVREVGASADPREGKVTSQVPGLGRVTSEDYGFLTLQFKDEDAAQDFMRQYEPSVDVDEMPSSGHPAAVEQDHIAERYNDVIRAICFEHSAGGYNSEGLMPPEAADRKLRWIIDDTRSAAEYRVAARANAATILYLALREMDVAGGKLAVVPAAHIAPGADVLSGERLDQAIRDASMGSAATAGSPRPLAISAGSTLPVPLDDAAGRYAACMHLLDCLVNAIPPEDLPAAPTTSANQSAS